MRQVSGAMHTKNQRLTNIEEEEGQVGLTKPKESVGCVVTILQYERINPACTLWV